MSSPGTGMCVGLLVITMLPRIGPLAQVPSRVKRHTVVLFMTGVRPALHSHDVRCEGAGCSRGSLWDGDGRLRGSNSAATECLTCHPLTSFHDRLGLTLAIVGFLVPDRSTGRSTFNLRRLWVVTVPPAIPEANPRDDHRCGLKHPHVGVVLTIVEALQHGVLASLLLGQHADEVVHAPAGVVCVLSDVAHDLSLCDARQGVKGRTRSRPGPPPTVGVAPPLSPKAGSARREAR